MFLKEKVTITIKKPRISFNKKKEKEDILNKTRKPDIPPRSDPKNNLIFNIFFFKAIEIPSNNIKSNKELIKKT